jgi:hypothetical protein
MITGGLLYYYREILPKILEKKGIFVPSYLLQDEILHPFLRIHDRRF